MTVDTQVLSGTYSPDGTISIEESFTPNDGEVWYVDAIIGYSEGTGSLTSEYGPAMAVWASNDNPTASDLMGTTLYQSTNLSTDTFDSSTVSIGVFIGSGSSVHVIDRQDTNDNGTFHYEIVLRRVV